MIPNLIRLLGNDDILQANSCWPRLTSMGYIFPTVLTKNEIFLSVLVVHLHPNDILGPENSMIIDDLLTTYERYFRLKCLLNNS